MPKYSWKSRTQAPGSSFSPSSRASVLYPYELQFPNKRRTIRQELRSFGIDHISQRRRGRHMRKSLVSVAVLLLSGYFGNAQDTSPIHVAIQAAPEQIKNAPMAMFARNGYSLKSNTRTPLKISKPFSEEGTALYNTAHWLNQPVQNCRH